MEGIFKDIQDALPGVLDSSRKVQKVEQSLHTSLVALQDQQNDDKCLLLLKSGIMYLIKVLHLMTRSVPLAIGNNILNLILDSLISASERGSKSNSFVVSSITDQCIEVVLNDKFAFLSRIEVLNKLNLIFESTDITVKEQMLQTEACRTKLKCLFQLVLLVGDYEFQVCIVEYLFRLLPRKLRQKYSSYFIEDPKTLQAFLAVKDSHFEVDGRKFLNHLNKRLADKKKVYSFPCTKITFGSLELQKPCDDGYDDFWLDVNTGSKRILIFCENAQLSSQASASEDCWDTISVWQDDVQKFVCHEENGELHSTIHLKSKATCIPRGWDHCISPLLCIDVHKEHDLEAALFQIFGQEKVSDVADPVRCFTVNSSKEHYSQDLSEMEDEDDENESSSEEDSVVPERHPSVTGTGQRKGVKMSTPASTITVGSLEGFRSIKGEASRNRTPKPPIPWPTKKMKAPVVTVQQPVSKPTTSNTRKTVKTKPSSSLVEKNHKEQKQLLPKIVGKDMEVEPVDFVIPDSLPIVSQAVSEPSHLDEAQASSRKTNTIDSDRDISLTDQTPLKPRASESAKVQKLRSTEKLEKTKDFTQNTGRTLRSAQNRNMSPCAPSQQSVHLSSWRRTTGQLETKLSKVCASQTSADKRDMCKKLGDSHAMSSRIEEFKAQRNQKTKTSSPSCSKLNSLNTQRSRQEAKSRSNLPKNSTDEEKLKKFGRDGEKTKKQLDDILRDGTNSLNIPKERKQNSSREHSTCTSTKPEKNNDKTRRAEQSSSGKHQNLSSSDNSLQSQKGQKPMKENTQVSSINPELTRNTRSMHHEKMNVSGKKTPGSDIAGDFRKGISKDYSQTENLAANKIMSNSTVKKGGQLIMAETRDNTLYKEKKQPDKDEDHRTKPPANQLAKQNELSKKPELREPVIDKKACDSDKPGAEVNTCSMGKMSCKEFLNRQNLSDLPDQTDFNTLQKPKSFSKHGEQSARRAPVRTNTKTRSMRDMEKSRNSSSSEKHRNQTYDSSESDEDDSTINHRLEIETNAEKEVEQNKCDATEKIRNGKKQHLPAGDYCKQRVRDEPESFEVRNGQTVNNHEALCQNNEVTKTSKGRKSLGSGKNFDQTETNGEHESSDSDDNEDFRFNHDIPEETPSRVESAEKPHRKKLAVTPSDEELLNDYLYKSSGKTTPATFIHDENQKENFKKPQKAKKNVRPLLANHKKQDTAPPKRNLRKQQSKSYKDVDSEEDLEAMNNKGSPLEKQGPSASSTAGNSFLSTQAMQTVFHYRDKFVKRALTVSISNTCEGMCTDPYSFEEETEYAEHCGKTAPSAKQHQSFSRCESQKSVEKSATSRDQKKMNTSRTFSWDISDEDDDDADADMSQGNKRQRQDKYWRISSIGSLSSLLPIKFNTPDPTLSRSGDSLNRASPCLFYSQKKKSMEMNSDVTCSGVLSTSPVKQKKSKERQKKHGSKEEPGAVGKSKVRNSKTPEKTSSFYLAVSDADTIMDKKSEVSWISKRKTKANPDPKVKTYKRKPGSPFSPGNGPSLVFSKHKSTGYSSELDSVFSSPEPVSVTPRQCNRRMFSPLDMMPSSPAPDVGKDNFDTNLRTRSNSKAFTTAIITDSPETQHTQIQVAAECSPSPTSNFLTSAAPVKHSNKVAKTFHGVHHDEDYEEEEETMRDFKRRGLLSGPSSLVRPSKSALKRTYGECSGLDTEDEDEDNGLTQSGKRRCLQPKQLFSEVANNLSDLMKETCKKDRKRQAVNRNVSKKSATFQTETVAIMSTEMNEDDVMALGVAAPSVSTDEFLSQPEIELEEPVTRVSALDSVTEMATLLKGFGFDLQKHMKEKELQVQDLAKSALKLVSKQAKQIWVADQSKWEHVLKNFTGHICRELSVLEQEIGGLNTIEKKAEATYLEQMKVLCAQREKIQQRVCAMRECHENLSMETKQVENQSQESQKCLEMQMKKEMERLKIKMLLDMQQQQLQRIKESLRKHII